MSYCVFNTHKFTLPLKLTKTKQNKIDVTNLASFGFLLSSAFAT